MPLGGASPVVTWMCSIAWQPTATNKPKAHKAQKRSRIASVSFIEYHTSASIRPRTVIIPNSPSSSPISANT